MRGTPFPPISPFRIGDETDTRAVQRQKSSSRSTRRARARTTSHTCVTSVLSFSLYSFFCSSLSTCPCAWRRSPRLIS